MLDEVNEDSGFISGDVFHIEELEEELTKCKAYVKEIYPNDVNPNIQYAELPIGS